VRELSLLKQLVRDQSVDCVSFESSLAFFIFPAVLYCQVTRDSHVGGFFVPANTTIAVSTYRLHRDPAVFDSPELYRPERFRSRTTLDKLIADRRYVPFGSGRHMCPGQKLVKKLMDTIWGTLFENYDVKLMGTTALPKPTYVAAVGSPYPESSIRVSVVRR
jgi:cytochrome P450